MESIYELVVKDQKGNDVKLSDYKDKVILVVNTATGCGFTPQYEGLQKLYDTYKDKGFTILDFPCNQFLNQAPGSDEEIHSFCSLKYNVSFPQFHKIKVNGKEEDPLYTFLKSKIKGRIMWNFTKFLIDKKGNVVERFAPTTKPENIEESIKKLLD